MDGGVGLKIYHGLGQRADGWVSAEADAVGQFDPSSGKGALWVRAGLTDERAEDIAGGNAFELVGVAE